MKNVLFVIDTLRMGGAEKSLISLLKALDPNKINVDLFLFEHGGVLQDQVPKWVNILGSDSLTKGMTLELRKYLGEVIKGGHFKAALARIKMTLRAKLLSKTEFNWKIVEPYIPKLEKQYDVAVGYLEGFPDFYVIDKVTAKKKIGWIHIDYSGKSLPEEAVRYYNSFDALVTISDICKKAFTDVVPGIKNKIQVLENIVLSSEIKQLAQMKCPDTWRSISGDQIVSVGRLDYQKGFDIGAKAARILRDKGYDFCWHVYGQGVMENEINQYIRENELENYYILEGLTENPYPYMKKADIIVQPSRWEGKSLVLDEAKILGKAIVVTDYPSVTDQVINGKTGIITGLEPEAIAEGIEMLIQKKDLRSVLEKNCRQEPNYSYQIVDRFYEMLDI